MFLVERRGEIVSIDVLLDEVWRDRSEEPAYVRKAVHEIRAALGDDDQQIVRNLPRVGYIIEPDAVEEEEAAGERPMTASSPLEQPLVYGSLSSDSYENISRRLRKTDQQDES